ncbi:transporter substrate-binding domain-containing protein [Roseococcus sp. SDR]|uniref:substrate-binding periplasmic protein n=1 Tax=Roseococcus sp. SDR TaxID=2835532 RepID=UPI001BCAD8A2|nr:transporter substrate-binding domain-containing protein [Roseococcus sp. SDR]MBS7789714.1 amino acid ABC transporter substrate-binding protein [Roseococcus sp. SDR]MBV1845028.1 transporter substrate-binding domain-containing protein [Roseococcus sp. SDR]
MLLARRALPALVGAAVPALHARANPPGGALGRILARGRIRIGVWLEGGPYGFRRPDGTLSGMEVETARDIARFLGVTAELVPLPFSERFPMVQRGHVDIACALMLITPARLRQVAFAAPHGEFTTVLATTRHLQLTSLAELDGRRILTLSNDMLGDDPGLPPGVQFQFIASYDEAIALLHAEHAAAVVLGLNTFRRLALAHPEEELRILAPLGEFRYAVALPQGEPDLLRFLNTWVFLREQDETFASLYETFMGGPRPDVSRL